MTANGVRSSWEALAANRCCSATWVSSRASMASKASASSRNSSLRPASRIRWDSDPAEAVRALSGGGTDFVFETAGHGQTMLQAYNATRRGGTTVTMSLPDPKVQLNLPAVSLVVEERSLKGSYMGSAVPSRDVPRYIALYKSGALPVDQLLTHKLKLDEINEGFDRLAKGEAVRQVILF